jgi:hypothetical protein
MAIVDPNTLTIGQNIRFKTLSPHDNVLWSGKIKAITDYSIAKNYSDVDTYYQDIVRNGIELAAKENLSYLLINISEDTNVNTIRVFATAFLDVSTLEIIDVNTYTTFKVYDISSDKAKDLLTTIQSLGYVAEIS